MRTIGMVRARAKIGFPEPGLQHSPPGDAGTARRGMKVKSLCSFNRSSGRDGAVKTATKLKTAPTLCPITRQNRPLFEVPNNRKEVSLER